MCWQPIFFVVYPTDVARNWENPYENYIFR